jgi:hypothetical protein
LYDLHQKKFKQENKISLKTADNSDEDDTIGTVPEEEEPQSKADEKFILADAFFQGFRSDEVFPHAMDCIRNSHSTVEVYNQTRQDWKDPSDYAYDNTTEKVFDTTEWISDNVAPMSSDCFLANLEIVVLY